MIFEADVKSFFDKVHRRTMLEMLGERIADKSFMRLVGKCLNVGVLDGQVFTRPDEGTVQGSIISPMLATFICTTCWTSGSKNKSSHGYGERLR